MTVHEFELFALALSAFLLAVSIPLAVVVIRSERRQKREASFRAAVSRALRIARVTTQTGQLMAITRPFIEEHVSQSTFGDRRRRTSHVTEFLKPETGPIETLAYAVKDPYEEGE